MPREIERKFLVADPGILAGRQGFAIVQGYLAKESMTVRVRTFGRLAFLTLKGPTVGFSRDEFEYPIPFEDALALLEAYCAPRLVRKTRYLVPHDPHVFEIDVFAGHLSGLIVAEIELAHENESFALPDWLGPEVTGDSRFGNFSLAHAESPPVISL